MTSTNESPATVCNCPNCGHNPNADMTRAVSSAVGNFEELAELYDRHQHDEQDALESIHASTHGVAWRTDWTYDRSRQPEWKYARITLSSGGPSSWIEAEISDRTVTVAKLMCKDWDTNPVECTGIDRSKLADIAGLILF